MGKGELPKGDEVIDVDMSSASGESTQSTEPKVKHYKVETSAEPTGYQTNKISSASAHLDPTRYGAKSGSKNRGLTVFTIIFAAIILGTLLGLPQSAVLVTVAAELFERTIPITVDQSIDKFDQITATIPGKLLELTNDDAKRLIAARPRGQ
jgi:hypothetical protein